MEILKTTVYSSVITHIIYTSIFSYVATESLIANNNCNNKKKIMLYAPKYRKEREREKEKLSDENQIA